MRFGGHQSFHLRDQWLYKGIYWMNESPKILLNTEKAMEELGVGKNMVESIKYWLRATKLAESNSSDFLLSDIAQKIFAKDPYFELDGTLFLIHYLLVTNKEEATAWQWFFNHFSAREFDRESLENAFSAYIQIKTNRQVKDKTLEKDLNCLLRMYQSVEYEGKKTPETETPSPFAKYGWIKKNGNQFIRGKLNLSDFNLHIFAFLLYLFWTEHLKRAASVNLEDLCNKENSVGRVFHFSIEEVADLIDLCSKKTKYLTYSRTGGYFIVHPKKDELKKSLDHYYKEMSLS